MPERVVRSSYHDREVDYYSSDDERSSHGRSKANGSTYRTVQRYRVAPSRGEEVDDTRSVRSSHREYENRQGDRIEVDRRVEIDRERERYDPEPRRTERIEVDRRVEVDRERYEPERPRSSIDFDRAVEYQRTTVERAREPEHERDRTRTVVYEREREQSGSPLPWERRRNDRPWETERDVRETRETDVTVEKTIARHHNEPYELERYSRETEYYDRPEPTPPPIIIRQRAPEPQQIIVQEAPSPAPIIIPQPAPESQRIEVIERKTEVQQEIVPRPEPRREEDEYYYRRDVREVGGRRDNEMMAYDRRDGRYDDGYESEDYIVRKKVVKREARSRSHSPHHRRHLAEGALAGAGAAALLANHREKQGVETARGRSVIGGAALGAIGAEVVTRARSRYRDSREDRSRSRSSSPHGHRKLKTALGLAAAAIAAGAAVKYAQNRNANKEELVRGRSRQRSKSRGRRYSDGDEYWSDEVYEKRTIRTRTGSKSKSRSRSRSRSRSIHADPSHRKKSMAKAGAGAAIAAGVAEHFRNKSRKRSGQRSQSRVRTAAEIAGSGLAGAAVAGLYENRKAKQEADEDEEHERRERRRSRTRSRSRARSTGVYSDPGVDPELGMVQYGTEPVYTHQQPAPYDRANEHNSAVAAAAAGAAYGASRRSRSRSRQRKRDSSSDDEKRPRSRSRSRSRVRDLAAGALGTGAAAIGIDQYRKRKEKKEKKEKKDAEKHERERERRRYEDEASPESYYTNFRDDTYSPSPPHASGSSYYPDNNQFPPPPTSAPQGFTHHGNRSTPFVNEIPLITPYNPQDYAGQRPSTHEPHVNYPPSSRIPGDNVSTYQSSNSEPLMTVPPHTRDEFYFPFHETSPPKTDHVYDREDRLNNSTPTPPLTPIDATPSNKSVMFAPLSPTSSRRLERIRNSKADQSTSTVNTYEQPNPSSDRRYRRRRRNNSDPSSDRPSRPRKHRKHRRGKDGDQSASEKSEASDEDVEVLPERFDREGKPLDRDASRERDIAKEFGGGNEIVERVVRGVGEVVAGKQTWGDLLMGFVKEGGLAGGSATDLSVDDREREREKSRDRGRKDKRSRSRGGERDY